MFAKTVLPKQIIMFGIVGIFAMCTHYLLAIFLFIPILSSPLLGNFLGYCSAFLVSYFGHSHLTFNTPANRKNACKFLFVSILGFSANESIFWLLAYQAKLNLSLSLIIAMLAVASSTFILGKFWAFSHASI